MSPWAAAPRAVRRCRVHRAVQRRRYIRAGTGRSRGFAAQVRQHRNFLSTGEHDTMLDGVASLVQKRVEVGHRAQMDVRCVVPLIRQAVGNGHPSLEDLPAVRPVAEVRERDDRLAADAQHLDDELLGVAHRLQRLRQDHAIE